MVRRLVAVAMLAAALTVVGTTPPVAAEDARLFATLLGANEVPGPGDPDAVGHAYITIDDAANQLCLSFSWRDVDGTLSGLHIHFAPPTAPGPIVVPFSVTQDIRGSASAGQTVQCIVVANEALLDNIAANPQQYYINLHSTPNYGPGAIRGQLQRV